MQGRLTNCRICGSSTVQYRRMDHEDSTLHVLSHECFPESEDPSNVITLRGPTKSSCEGAWRDLMRTRKPKSPEPERARPKKTTIDFLNDWQDKTGKSWIRHIEEQAKAGYSWGDLAVDFGVPRSNLRNYCDRSGLKFSWSSKTSPRTKTNWGDKYAKYTAFGVTATLPELVRMFSEPVDVTYNMVWIRLNRRGYTVDQLEQALTDPRITNEESLKRARRKRQENLNGLQNSMA